MAKRKATTSKTTSSKTPRIILSQLNLSALASAQDVAGVQQAEAVSNQRRIVPPTPPGAHTKYVPRSPRAQSIRLSQNISLSLNVKKPDERTNFAQEHPLTFTTVATPNSTVTTPRPQFILPETTQPPNVILDLTLRPVFDWTTHYAATLSEASDSSSEGDVEAESDVESESIYRVNVDELKPAELVELAVAEGKTHVVDTNWETKNNDDKQKSEAEETEEVNAKKSGLAVVNHLNEEPGVEEARESGERSVGV
jgi:hypothetical protein